MTSPRTAVRRLALGRAISVAGTFAAGTALVYTIYRETQSTAWISATMLLTWAACASVRASDSYHPASRRSGVSRIATFMIGFVLGGAVVGGAIYLLDTQDDSTSGPIEQPSVSGSLPAEDSPTPASSGTDAPDASPTPTMVEATRVTNMDELRIDGLGSMTIGMHVNDVERATGMNVDISSDFSPECRYGQLVGGPHDLFLMFSRRVLVRIDIVSGSAIETDTGIGVGDPISAVEAAYGDELERELHPYLGDRGSYLIFDPEPEDGLLIIFEANRRSVTSFRSGFDEQVRYKEGCA